MARAATREDVLAFVEYTMSYPPLVNRVTAERLIDEMLSETLTLSPIDIVRLTELMAADLGMVSGEDVDYGQL
jgi:hypothetical protein